MGSLSARFDGGQDGLRASEARLISDVEVEGVGAPTADLPDGDGEEETRVLTILSSDGHQEARRQALDAECRNVRPDPEAKAAWDGRSL